MTRKELRIAVRRESSSARMDRLAYILDTVFRVPGTEMRFGIDPILGLIPGLGDATGLVLSAYLVLEAARTRASRSVLLRMLFNVTIDSIFSVVPFAGDLLDAGWKANTRNLSLLRRHLDDPRGTDAASRTFILLVFLGLILLFVATVVSAVFAIRWVLGLF